ncbi:MAG: hypothetical protein QOD72_1920, partial [Acidimicrobiaceae bacterium]|nr:hypothetical protein [Acidimicrobiaceae bacterium]
EGITQESWKSPVSFMLANGLVGGSAGYVPLLKAQGCTTMGMIATVSPGNAGNIDSLAHSMELEAKQLGLDFKGYISAPVDAPDMAPYATQAADAGQQCTVPIAFGPQAISLLTALGGLVDSGKIKKVGICTCSVTPQVADALAAPITKLGDAAVLTLGVESPQNLSNPAVKQWVDDEAAYGPKPPHPEFQSGMQWAELQLAIHSAVAVTPNITGESVLKYLSNLKEYWPGLAPPVDFTKAPDNPYGPRVFASWVAPTTWTGGKDWARKQPFISILTNQPNENAVPAGCTKWVDGGCAP